MPEEQQPSYLSTDPTDGTAYISHDPNAGILDAADPGWLGTLAHGFAKSYPAFATASAVTGAAEPVIGGIAAAAAPTLIGPAVVEAVGNAAVWLGTYAIASRLIDHGEKALSESSPTVKNYLDAVQAHPVADQIGQLAALGPEAATSIKGFYDLATNAKTASEAAKTIGKRVVGGAVAGAAITPIQPAIDWGINKLGQAFGISPEEIQKPDVRSYLMNIGIGTVLSGRIKEAADAKVKAPEAEAPVEVAPPAPSETAPAEAPRAFTEPILAQVQSLQTADVTRAILDQRNALLTEAQQLGRQADISRAMGQPVHPTIQSRLAEINLELNQPSITPEAAARSVYLPALVEAPAAAPERVQPGEFREKGYTAVTTPEVAAPMEPQTPPHEAQAADPAVSELANKYVAQRVAKGELGLVTPWGEVYSPTEMRLRGARMGPEEINQHISNLMQNAGGDPILQGAAVSAEEARLRQRSQKLSAAARDNPGSAEAQRAQDNAFKDLTDFQNGPVAKLKNIWATQGRGLQGSIEIDLSTANGLREQWLRDTGNPVPSQVEPKLRDMANKVNGATQADNGARQRLGQEIDRVTKGSKIPSADDVRRRVAETMGVEPCRI